jgi:hypothetical protein
MADVIVLDDYRSPAWSPAQPQVDIGDFVWVPNQSRLGVGRVTYVSDVHGVMVLEMAFPNGIARKLPAREVELYDPHGAA